MIKQAIILAGGLGTRLRSVVTDLPKCLAPVAGKPFLHYVITHLQKNGIEEFVFSIGYKGDAIVDYVNSAFSGLNFSFSIEEEPLGTGGAIKHALTSVDETNVIIVNGDTLFSVDLQNLSIFHKANKADCTLALKPMTNFDRYGVVELNEHNRIISFKEKSFYKQGLINGGIYGLNVKSFLSESLPQIFSFEKDYLEKFCNKKRMFGFEEDSYFIDIGIPEDYAGAQTDLQSS
ncbi:nucleotidyltransferase family protein [soil metagenome]